MKCLKCGADAPPNLTSSLCSACIAKKQEGVPKGLLLVGILIGILIIAVALSSHPNQTPSSPETSSVRADVPPSTIPSSPSIVSSSWDYSTVEMDAGAKTAKIGCIQLDNMVSLNDPYSDTYTTLCFRSDSTVLFHLDHPGQLLNGEEHGARIRIADGPPRSFALEETADYSSDKAFIEPAGPLFAAVKAGKKIAISATYYEAGTQTVTFTPNEPLKLK